MLFLQSGFSNTRLKQKNNKDKNKIGSQGLHPRRKAMTSMIPFAPTLKQNSLRIITTIAVNKNFQIKQIDLNSA